MGLVEGVVALHLSHADVLRRPMASTLSFFTGHLKIRVTCQIGIHKDISVTAQMEMTSVLDLELISWVSI